MKIEAARQLVSILTEAIADAEVGGSDTVNLVDRAKNIDDEARQALVDAIADDENK